MVYPFGILLLCYIVKQTLIGKTGLSASGSRPIRKSLEELQLFLLSLLITLELFVSVGYFIKIGGYELLYDELVLILTILVSLALIIQHREGLKLKASMIFFLISIVATEVWLILHPIREVIYRNGHYLLPGFSSYSVFVALKVITMVVISMVTMNYIKLKQLDQLTKQIINNGAVVYVVLGIEWIVKNIFHSDSYHTLVNLLFGKGAYTVDYLLTRGSGYSIQGLHREPADLSFGLFIFLIVVVLSNLEQKVKNRYLAIGLLFMTISGSFSGIGYGIALIIFYILSATGLSACGSQPTRKKLGPIVCATFFILMLILVIPNDLFSYYMRRVINSINFFNVASSQSIISSEQVRLFSIQETLHTVYIKRPILGAGLGTPYAYSSTVMILSSIGGLGSLTWFWYYFITIGKAKSLKKITMIFTLLAVLTFIGSIKMLYSGFVLLLALRLRYYNHSEEVP